LLIRPIVCTISLRLARGSPAPAEPFVSRQVTAAMRHRETSHPAPSVMPRQRAHGSAAGLVRALLDPEIRGWRGEQPLWKVFWGYGVLGGGSFYVLYAFALHGGRIGLQQALLACIAGYSFWMLMSLWRCSETMTGTLCGALARQAAVAWAGNTILFLIFLQLALIGKYLGAA
jgi:hypothetical protein